MMNLIRSPARLLAALLAALFPAAAAGAPRPDKSQYHLFNPTPLQWLRVMNTDRPDKTKAPSPWTPGISRLRCTS